MAKIIGISCTLCDFLGEKRRFAQKFNFAVIY